MFTVNRGETRSLQASDIISGEWLDATSCAIFLGIRPDKSDRLVSAAEFPAPGWSKTDGEPLWRIGDVALWGNKNVRVADVDESTCLYRHFDSQGRLLYVGIALCASKRASEHKHRSPWFRSVSNITVEWFPTRRAALAAEKAAIAQESPMHNVSGLPKSPRRAENAEMQKKESAPKGA